MKILKKKSVCIFVVLLIILIVRHIIYLSSGYRLPDYPKTDISHLLTNEHISDADYELIFKNTGVSPAAAKDLVSNNDTETLLQLNELYFQKQTIHRNYICYPVTAEERNSGQVTPLVDLKKGDILITFNTATLDWRHGHIGMVLDNGLTMLEHMAIGDTSCITYVDNWGNYPSFAVLRYPDADVASEAAQYAEDNLVDVKYSIFAGINGKDKSKDDFVDESHCSHIVWQAYKSAGADIDSNGGFIVTPDDIARCDDLYVVQIFGMDCERFENRILK